MLVCMNVFKEEYKITSDFLASSIHVNPVIIRKLLSQLKDAGLIEVKRGTGGATIAKPLEKLTFQHGNGITSMQQLHEKTLPRTALTMTCAVRSLAGSAGCLPRPSRPQKKRTEPLLFTEQVAVCPGAGQGQHQYIVLNAVDQQPIRENMTLTVSHPIPGLGVIFVLFRERFAHCKSSNHIL